jgi:NAD(P)-dependent dehydrogenase (short-subunit alcohol dehydrogenase family)
LVCNSSGIGLESSILFASEGASVVLADINLAAAEKAKQLITSKHPNAKTLVIKSDVGKETDVKFLVGLTIQEFGRLDIMVSLLVLNQCIYQPLTFSIGQFNNAGQYFM